MADCSISFRPKETELRREQRDYARSERGIVRGRTLERGEHKLWAYDARPAATRQLRCSVEGEGHGVSHGKG